MSYVSLLTLKGFGPVYTADISKVLIDVSFVAGNLLSFSSSLLLNCFPDSLHHFVGVPMFVLPCGFQRIDFLVAPITFFLNVCLTQS